MNKQELLDLLYYLYDMPQPRIAKCISLHRLAQDAVGGAIVELGTFHGNGTISLCAGTDDGNKLDVYTIDDYVQKKGWAGEQYQAADEARFLANIDIAGFKPTLIKKSDAVAVASWKLPIALLFWDLGCGSSLNASFIAWKDFIVQGGVFAVHDTMDRRLGSGELIRKAAGFTHRERMPGGIDVLVKK